MCLGRRLTSARAQTPGRINLCFEASVSLFHSCLLHCRVLSRPKWVKTSLACQAKGGMAIKRTRRRSRRSGNPLRPQHMVARRSGPPSRPTPDCRRSCPMQSANCDCTVCSAWQNTWKWSLITSKRCRLVQIHPPQLKIRCTPLCTVICY